LEQNDIEIVDLWREYLYCTACKMQ